MVGILHMDFVMKAVIVHLHFQAPHQHIAAMEFATEQLPEEAQVQDVMSLKDSARNGKQDADVFIK